MVNTDSIIARLMLTVKFKMWMWNCLTWRLLSPSVCVWSSNKTLTEVKTESVSFLKSLFWETKVKEEYLKDRITQPSATQLHLYTSNSKSVQLEMKTLNVTQHKRDWFTSLFMRFLNSSAMCSGLGPCSISSTSLSRVSSSGEAKLVEDK